MAKKFDSILIKNHLRKKRRLKRKQKKQQKQQAKHKPNQYKRRQ